MKDSKFAKAARGAMQSWIKENREPISTDEVIEKYPDGITLMAFDLVENSKGCYAVFNFAEDLSKYVCGGKAGTDIAVAWAEMYEGDTRTASDELKRDGGYKVKFVKTKTRDGNPFIRWDEVE